MNDAKALRTIVAKEKAENDKTIAAFEAEHPVGLHDYDHDEYQQLGSLYGKDALLERILKEFDAMIAADVTPSESEPSIAVVDALRDVVAFADDNAPGGGPVYDYAGDVVSYIEGKIVELEAAAANDAKLTTIATIDLELTNDDRATMAEHALAVIEDGQGKELAIVDLLANLGHLCDREGWILDDLYGQAMNHYDAELNGEVTR